MTEQVALVKRGTKFLAGNGETWIVKQIRKDGVLFEDGYLASFSEVEGWLGSPADKSVTVAT